MKRTAQFFVLALALAASRRAWAQTVLFADSFTRPDGLITNEFAYWNPTDPRAVKSADWEMTSGSVFASGSAGWSGKPDNVRPDALSSNGTNSAVFRLTSRRYDFLDAALQFSLLNQGLVSTSSTPPVDWDGVSVLLRYQSEESLYAMNVNRRDGKTTIKKKVPGGASNGGTYYTLATGAFPVPFGVWQLVRASALNQADGSVALELAINGATLARAVDSGTGGPAIRAAGKIGVRGDNCDFKFDELTVAAPSAPAPSPEPAPEPAPAPVPGDSLAPTVVLSAPQSGKVSGLVRVAAEAYDNVGVAGVQFLLDGRALGPEDVAAPFELMWDSAGSKNGTHGLAAVARDVSGNRTVSNSVTVWLSGKRN